MKQHVGRLAAGSIFLLLLFFAASMVRPLSVSHISLLAAVADANPTCTLRASASSVVLGDTVNLTWTSTNAISGTITSIGSVDSSGTQGVIPTGSGKTYVAVFTGSSGATATCSVRVTTTSGSDSTYTPPTYIPSTDTYVPRTYTPPTYTAPTAPTYTTTPADSTTDPPATTKTTAQGSYPSGLVSCGATPAGDAKAWYMWATECGLCNLGQLIQNIINYMLAFAIPISIALFAYVGVLYFGSAASPAGIEKAKGIFKTTFIGLAVALAAYLIVQLLLSTLLATSFLDVNNWKTLKCASNDDRPRSKTVADIFEKWTTSKDTTAAKDTGVVGTGTVTSGGKGYAKCADDNTACSTKVLTDAGLTDAQADAMSCIAVTENSGFSTGCSNTSTPCGTFQINNGNWTKYAPAGCTDRSMKNNASCNLKTATIMVKTPGVGYQPWTGTCTDTRGCGTTAYGQQWNPKASSCVSNWDPNTTLKK